MVASYPNVKVTGRDPESVQTLYKNPISTDVVPTGAKVTKSCLKEHHILGSSFRRALVVRCEELVREWIFNLVQRIMVKIH